MGESLSGDLSGQVEGRRLSGEACTSIGCERKEEKMVYTQRDGRMACRGGPRVEVHSR